MVREVRASAIETHEAPAGIEELQGVLQSHAQPVIPSPVDLPAHSPTEVQAMAAFAAQAALVDPDHWLPMFVEDLTWQLRRSGGISFEVAERLLQQRKDDFLKDFLIARRMYRTYPHLFPELKGQMSHAAVHAISHKASSGDY